MTVLAMRINRGKRVFRRTVTNRGITMGRVLDRLSRGYHLIRLIDTYDIDCVIDVGANRGQFAGMLRADGYEGHIVSFEPVPEAYAQLLARINDDPNWTARQLALSDEPGMLTMNVAASSSVSSFLQPTQAYAAAYAGARTTRVEEVSAERLDDAVAELPYERIFLKTDTQGYDLKVLAGASRTLDRVSILQIEMSVISIYEGMPDYITALSTVRDLGFTPAGIFSVTHDERLRVDEFDGVFVPRQLGYFPRK